MRKKNLIIAILLCILLLGIIIVSLVRCSMKIQATDLMEGISAKEVSGKPSDDEFINSSANFAVELFKSTVAVDKNSLISPLSVMLALSMTANGADGQTKKEMETLLGGKMSLDELNNYLYTYVKNLPSSNKYKFEMANSIWFKNEESFTVENEFLQKNSDYYGAQIYKSKFDDKAVIDINRWVKNKTAGMIDDIIGQIDPQDVMFIINAIAFDAEWENKYDDSFNGEFTTFDGTKRNVKMMSSSESKFIDDGKATGFIKSYKDDKYSFVALLPNEDISINDYISTLTGESLLAVIKSPQHILVESKLPKFSSEYSLKMNDALKSLGMSTAFNESTADFSMMGKSFGNLYIGSVIHKTYIEVSEFGTKAGASTVVEMKNTAAVEAGKTVILNRPFVYAIIDNSTNLPIFIGTVMDIK